MIDICAENVKELLPKRSPDANKYSVGTLLCVCGSYAMAGACVLCAKAALRSGAGMVRCAVPRSIYPIVSAAVPEAVFIVLEENSVGALSAECAKEIVKAAECADAVVFGCGSKLCTDTQSLAITLLSESTTPLIIDADGINALSKHINVLDEAKCKVVLTPHEGEMSRLTGKPSEMIKENREEVAQEFADAHDCVVTLKGMDTLIARKGKEIRRNTTGNAGMAVAGSGDVLTGIMGGLLAQGLRTVDAASLGVYIHGRAGDLAAMEYTQYSMLPSDIIEFIPAVFKELSK